MFRSHVPTMYFLLKSDILLRWLLNLTFVKVLDEYQWVQETIWLNNSVGLRVQEPTNAGGAFVPEIN